MARASPRGLVQRAELLEAVRRRHLRRRTAWSPRASCRPGLIAGSREWLRPLVGVQPARRPLPALLAFELGRGPDGSWWVLGDRTQAPSGAGFALENRVATTRASSPTSTPRRTSTASPASSAPSATRCRASPSDRDGRVAHPDARAAQRHLFRARLHRPLSRLHAARRRGPDRRATAGVMVRTVAGLKPVSVLWRRLDAAFADPLELDARLAHRHARPRRGGAPGLGDAGQRARLRHPRDPRAPRLPAAHRRGAARRAADPAEHRHLVVRPAGRARARPRQQRPDDDRPGALDPACRSRTTTRPCSARRFRDARRAPSFDAWLEADGAELVGQEAVTLSTTPAYVDGGLVPRPMSLRVFLARTPHGWQVMPGGFARIGRTADADRHRHAARRHGRRRLGGQRQRRSSPSRCCPPASATPYARVRPGSLPSRAADNLFWLGRYVERAEGTVRILRAYHVAARRDRRPRAAAARRHPRPISSRSASTPTRPCPPALLAMLDSAVVSAGQIRDRFSPDGWLALNDLAKTARNFAERVAPGDDATRAMTRAPAQARRLLRPRAREHVPLHRLALPVDRPPPRARASQIVRRARPGSPTRTRPTARSTCCRDRRQRHDPPPPLHGAPPPARPSSTCWRSTRSTRARCSSSSASSRTHVACLPGAEVDGQMSHALPRGAAGPHRRSRSRPPRPSTAPALRALILEIEALSNLLSDTYLR